MCAYGVLFLKNMNYSNVVPQLGKESIKYSPQVLCVIRPNKTKAIDKNESELAILKKKKKTLWYK